MFIEAIRKYKTSGDREIIDRVRSAMNTDFLSYQKRGGTASFEQPEMYIAFRCLRLIGGKLATIKYTLSESGYDIRSDSPEWVFADFARIYRQWFGVEITVDNFEQYEASLRDYFVGTFHEMYDAYLRMIGEKPRIWQLLTDRIIDEHWPSMSQALMYALDRVNPDSSEREIVRYINSVVRTEYYRLQIEANGLRRVRRKNSEGEVVTKYVEPRFISVEYAVLGNLRYDGAKLSVKQRQFYEVVAGIVAEDLAESTFGNYNVDNRGAYRIRNRYIAERIGRHEASVSRSLSEIRSILIR
jgi:hypothetical protein